MTSSNNALSDRISTVRSTLAMLAGLALFPMAAVAEDAPNVLTDSFNISLGTFVISTDTQIRVDGAAGEQGTPVDWEQTFGEGDVTRFRLDGYWRFADRHKVRGLIFSTSRKNSRTINETIDWGGEEFPVDAKVTSEFGFDIYELAYEYAFVRREKYEIDASIGLHYTDLSASLKATVDLPEGSGTESIKHSASVGAPLPVIGLRGTWVLPYNLSIDASGQFFALSIDQYDGDLQDYRVVLNWQPKKWVGLGVGYDYFAVNVDVDTDNFKGKLDWKYRGPMIFYSVSF